MKDETERDVHDQYYGKYLNAVPVLPEFIDGKRYFNKASERDAARNMKMIGTKYDRGFSPLEARLWAIKRKCHLKGSTCSNGHIERKSIEVIEYIVPLEQFVKVNYLLQCHNCKAYYRDHYGEKQ